jgi:hypothetical protein
VASLKWRSHWHCGIWSQRSHWNQNRRCLSPGVIETVGLDPAVSMTPVNLIPSDLIETTGFYPGCHWNRGIGSRSFNDTAESACNGIIWDCGIFYKNFNLESVNPLPNDTADSDPAVSMKMRNAILQSHWDCGIWICRLLSRITQRIWSHMRIGFSLWISALGGLFKIK